MRAFPRPIENVARFVCKFVWANARSIRCASARRRPDVFGRTPSLQIVLDLESKA